MNPATVRSALVVLALFYPSFLSADTLTLKDSREEKGLVVEEHEDRVVFSTADGERVFLRKDIEKIEFDELEYNLMNLGRESEKAGKSQVALSYYEKALEINPDIAEAKQAMLGIKSRLWAEMLDAGPHGEVSQQQDFLDSYRANVGVDDIEKKHEEDQAKLLWQRLGVKLEGRKTGVAVGEVRIGGYFHKRGLRRGDGFASVDGRSMRYLNPEAVTLFLLEPRFANATLMIERPLVVVKPSPRASLKEVGFRIRQEYNGLTVSEVEKTKEKELRLRRGDLITQIGNIKTRYMPQKDAIRMLQDPKQETMRLTIHRSVTIARK